MPAWRVLKWNGSIHNSSGLQLIRQAAWLYEDCQDAGELRRVHVTLRSRRHSRQCTIGAQQDALICPAATARVFDAQAQSRPITIADIPTDVLPVLLSKIVGIKQLDVRADLASVSKAFALAILQQKAVTLSSTNLVRPYDASQRFVYKGFAKLQAKFQHMHITTLKLQQVSTCNLSCMMEAASCCQDWHIDLKSESYRIDTVTIECLWDALGRKASSAKHLQQSDHLSKPNTA